MAKLGKVSEETERMVNAVVTNAGLDMFMNIEPISIDKQKVVIKVARANATTEYKAKCPDTVFLYIYEEALMALNKRQQELLIEDAIANINYDSEKDKISIGCPQIVVTVGGRTKYGDELINAAECSVHALYELYNRKQAQEGNCPL